MNVVVQYVVFQGQLGGFGEFQRLVEIVGDVVIGQYVMIEKVIVIGYGEVDVG